MTDTTTGTQGYGAEADVLAVQYESVTFEEVHGELLHLLPAAPARVLDIGAGTGRDAAALARLGHTVTAAEPTAELRAHAERLHADTAVSWLDDALPELAGLRARGERFDLILITAVWMHLDAAERARAMPNVAELLAPGGTLLMRVRSGPVPPGRRMFEVPDAETVALAEAAGLRVLHRGGRVDLHGRSGVSWSELGFTRP
ncbi:bifunctional 2-polyprenyl-6-hydroxyphenol methylase/3-demethylubiquinol 3-O-methyltransferase UbiG [Streptomyces sp. CBMA152]|uniref:class I SAM-dependent methyltransferase n=1 Tax=Streptomyces sp. CBMA152 TaxID=1896312 RepID=UPI0016603527|nr:class I SAM-dependent methyltransferase [Streptomyces sp. CBMA152]MBD0746918.1 SAM-dependent methyltransferase [Streptomyces sp. CBMA152]